MAEYITVTETPSLNIDIFENSTNVNVQDVGGVSISVDNGVREQNLVTGDFTDDQLDGLLVGPGIIIQTGLGPNGDDFTLWIEDGK